MRRANRDRAACRQYSRGELETGSYHCGTGVRIPGTTIRLYAASAPR